MNAQELFAFGAIFWNKNTPLKYNQQLILSISEHHCCTTMQALNKQAEIVAATASKSGTEGEQGPLLHLRNKRRMMRNNVC